ncbi:MAG: DUF4340 domain-containing protein [Cyanobacteria bacterium P01_F01_bin.56]
MKLQRSTVVLVATALLLGGVVLLTQSRESTPTGSTAEQNNPASSPIYDFAETDVVVLQIETAGQIVVFEKDDEDFWQMVEPDDQPAEEAAIAFLLSRLVTDGLLSTTTIEAANQSDFGLDDPFATVALTLADGTSRTLILGDADFSGDNYYALVDPETFPLTADAGEVEVAIVTQNIINGVDRPLDEWQAVIDDNAASGSEEADLDESDLEAEDTLDSNETDVEATELDADSDAADTDDESDAETEALEESGNNSEESAPDTENSETTDNEDPPTR